MNTGAGSFISIRFSFDILGGVELPERAMEGYFFISDGRKPFI
jgi:hypothetical protein